MIQTVKDKRITVAGLGRFGGGIAVARWLVGQGAKVLVTDRDPIEKLQGSVNQLAGLPIEFRLGEQRERDFSDTDLVVTSPALSPNNPFLLAAASANVPISTEIRLFIERLPHKVTTIGVTGTKGKSTTTKLLSLMLATQHKVWTGGNIGGSLLEQLPQIFARDVVVLELSSYMLEYLRPMNWSPRIAVMTMLSVDHIEWHGSERAYLDAKKNLLRHQSTKDLAVFCDGDPALLEEFKKESRGRTDIVRLDDRARFSLTIPGDHNQLNAHVAFAAAKEMGVSFGEAQSAVESFAGLPHRLERVHVSASGVEYFNDSIATIPQAAAAALRAFPKRRVIQIVGGYDKGLDMSPLTDALVEQGKAALVIGTIGPALFRAMSNRANNEFRVVQMQNLHEAMRHAKSLAVPGDIVLLSTGCASYDEFANFEERGHLFAEIARSQ